MIKRYTTFEELKANEKRTAEHKVCLRRHNEFKEVIKAIYTDKRATKETS